MAGSSIKVSVIGDAAQLQVALGQASKTLTKFSGDAEAAAKAVVAAGASQRESLQSLAAEYQKIAAAAEAGSSEQVAAAKLASDAQRALVGSTADAAKAAMAAAEQERTAMAAMKESLTSVQGSVAKTHDSFLSLSKVMNTALTFTIAGLGIKSVVDAATAFQHSMEIIHTQAGATQAEVTRMSAALMQLGPAVGTAPKDLADALFYVESAGLRGAKALEALKFAAEGAKVGGSDLKDTTDALVGAVKSGIEGTQNMSQAMGSLNAIVGSGKMTMQDLVGALSTGLLPIAAKLGVSLRDVGSALAVMTDRGIPAEKSATFLRQTLIGLQESTVASQKAFDSIGISSTQLGDVLRNQGLVPALELLKTKLENSGLTATEQTQVLAKAFGSRAMTGVVTLLGAMDSLKQKEQQIGDGANSFGQAWEATQKTAQFSMDRFHASMQLLEVTVGNELIPAVAKLANQFSDWITKAQKTGELQADINKVKSALDDVKSAVGFAKDAFGKLSDAVGGTKNAIELLIGVYATFKTVSAAGKFADAISGFVNLRNAANLAKGSVAAEGDAAVVAQEKTSALGSKLTALKAIGAIGITIAVGVEVAKGAEWLSGWLGKNTSFAGDTPLPKGLTFDMLAKLKEDKDAAAKAGIDTGIDWNAAFAKNSNVDWKTILNKANAAAEEAKHVGSVAGAAFAKAMQQAVAGVNIVSGVNVTPNFPGVSGTGGGSKSLPSPSSLSVSAGKQKMIQLAESMIGTPYAWGGSGPGGFDCSGLVMWAFANGMNINLPHFTGAQVQQGTQVFAKSPFAGTQGSMKNVKPGDVVFTEYDKNGVPQHEGLYVGGGMVVEAPHTGDKVKPISLAAFVKGQSSYTIRDLAPGAGGAATSDQSGAAAAAAATAAAKQHQAQEAAAKAAAKAAAAAEKAAEAAAKKSAAALKSALKSDQSGLNTDITSINTDLKKNMLSDDVAAELKKKAAAIGDQIKDGTATSLGKIKQSMSDLKAAIQQGVKQATDASLVQKNIKALQQDISAGLIDKSLGDKLLSQAQSLNKKLSSGLLSPADFKQADANAKALKAKIQDLVKQATDEKGVQADLKALNQAISTGVLPPSVADPMKKQLQQISADLVGSLLSDADRSKLEARKKAIEAQMKAAITEMKAQEADVKQDLSSLGDEINTGAQAIGLGLASVITPTQIASAGKSIASLNTTLTTKLLTEADRTKIEGSISSYQNIIQTGIGTLVQDVSDDKQKVAEAWTSFGNLVDQTFQTKVAGKFQTAVDALSRNLSLKQIAATISDDTDAYGKSLEAAAATIKAANADLQSQIDNAASGTDTSSLSAEIAANNDALKSTIPSIKATMDELVGLWRTYYADIEQGHFDDASRLQDQIVGDNEKIKTALSGLSGGALDAANDVVNSGNTLISDIQSQGDQLTAVAVANWQNLSDAQKTAIDNAITAAQTAVNNGQPIEDALQGLRAVFIANGLSPDDADKVLSDPITGALKDAVTGLNTAVGQLVQVLQGLAKALGLNIPGLSAASQGNADAVTGPFDDAATRAEAASARIVKAWQTAYSTTQGSAGINVNSSGGSVTATSPFSGGLATSTSSVPGVGSGNTFNPVPPSKPPAPIDFFTGGIAPIHAFSGLVVPGGPKLRDYIPAMLNGGEMILNGTQQHRLFNFIDNSALSWMPGRGPASTSTHGDHTFNFNFPNYVGDKRELVTLMRSEVQRLIGRNR